MEGRVLAPHGGEAGRIAREHIADTNNPHNVTAEQIPYDAENTVGHMIWLLEDLAKARKTIDVLPVQADEIIYDGKPHTPEWVGFDENRMIMTGIKPQTEAGRYPVIFTPKPGFHWGDTGNSEARAFYWELSGLPVDEDVVLTSSHVFDGREYTPTWTGIDPELMTVTGTTKATDAGEYVMRITLAKNRAWPDGTSEPRDFVWSIEKASGQLVLDKTSVSLDTGTTVRIAATAHTDAKINASTPKPSRCEVEVTGQYIQLSGGAQAGEAIVTVTASATKNYESATGTITVSNYLGSLSVPRPVNPTYDGTSKTVELDGFEPETMTRGGTLTAVNAGSYTATVTPKPGYRWVDGTITAKEIVWSVEPQAIEAPTTAVSTYDGTEHTVQWIGFVDSQMTAGGVLKATNAGTYTATVTPRPNWKWPDGSQGARQIQWTIEKALGFITPDKTFVEVDPVVPAVVTLTTHPGAEITAASTNPAYATTSVSGNKVTITGAGTAGDTTVTITAEEGPNHLAVPCVVNVKAYIESLKVPIANSVEYDGDFKEPDWVGFDATKMTASSAVKVSAGAYTAIVSPRSGYRWMDGTTEPKNVPWTITRKPIKVPKTISATYNGTDQIPRIDDSTTHMDGIQYNSGSLKRRSAGTYYLDVTPRSNYMWEDGTYNTVQVAWIIEPLKMDLPLYAYGSTYDGSPHTVNFTKGTTGDGGIHADGVVIVSGGTQTNAGTYTVTFKPDSNHVWQDGTKNNASMEWTIEKGAAIQSQDWSSWPQYNSFAFNETGTWRFYLRTTGGATFTPCMVTPGTFIPSGQDWRDFVEVSSTGPSNKVCSVTVKRIASAKGWECMILYDIEGDSNCKAPRLDNGELPRITVRGNT